MPNERFEKDGPPGSHSSEPPSNHADQSVTAKSLLRERQVTNEGWQQEHQQEQDTVQDYGSSSEYRPQAIPSSDEAGATPAAATLRDSQIAWSLPAMSSSDATEPSSATKSHQQTLKHASLTTGTSIADDPRDHEDNESVIVSGPYRHGNIVKPRGILKAVKPPQPRFSFRRDVLGYVVGEGSVPPSSYAQHSRIEAATSNTGQMVPSTLSVRSTISTQTFSSDIQEEDRSDSYGRRNSHTNLMPDVQQNVRNPTVHSGSLWKRLGGAVSAVAATMPVPHGAAKSLSSIASSARHFGQASDHIESHRLPTNESASNSLASQRPTKIGTSTNVESAQIGSDLPKEDLVKSVRFTMEALTVVYPINGPGPPGTEAATRRRINHEYRQSQKERHRKGAWSSENLLELYERCCRTREEPGLPLLRQILSTYSSPPKVIDLSNIALTRGSVDVLADILSVDFGLRKLVLENCSLDDDSLKPLIHALLVSGTLPSLSLACNKRLRIKSWQMLAIFVRRAVCLKYLDLSDNSLDKRGAELIGSAAAGRSSQRADHQPNMANQVHTNDLLHAVHESAEENDDIDPFADRHAALLSPSEHPRSASLASLRLENCSLRSTVLEGLAHKLRHSSINHISLRRNRINHLGAVALAVMIRDYDPTPVSSDSHTGLLLSGLTADVAATIRPDDAESPSQLSHKVPSVRLESTGSGNSVTARPVSGASKSGAGVGAKPVDVVQHEAQSVSSADVRHSNQDSVDAPANADFEDQDVHFGPERNRGRISVPEREWLRHTDMRSRLRKQIDALPRVGDLLTLDIRSNEIRVGCLIPFQMDNKGFPVSALILFLQGGITYISQVLKRNRTLRVLNVSDNKIDPSGLASLAEALKYNTTLETLDLSHNPCCGPSMDGIRSLRTALVVNQSILRLFLNNTSFENAGGIALAEYLPDVRSLIHLDLTDNPDLDIAGVMALAAAIKLNQNLRCLDMSIPIDNPELARLSQDILQSCIQNTENAQRQFRARGDHGQIANPLSKSGLAKNLQDLGLGEESSTANSPQSRNSSYHSALLASAESVISRLTKVVQMNLERRPVPVTQTQNEANKILFDEAVAVQLRLNEDTLDPSEKSAMSDLAGHIAVLLERAFTSEHFREPDTLGKIDTNLPAEIMLHAHSPLRSPLSHPNRLPSPSFSITDSDDSDSASSDTNRRGHHGTEMETPASGVESSSAVEVPVMQVQRPSVLELPSRPTTPLNGQMIYSPISPKSPIDNQSRRLTLEEGEVFRRGISKVDESSEQTLLDVIDRKTDVAGEDLKQVLLDTEVKRMRRSSVSVPGEMPSKPTIYQSQ